MPWLGTSPNYCMSTSSLFSPCPLSLAPRSIHLCFTAEYCYCTHPECVCVCLCIIMENITGIFFHLWCATHLWWQSHLSLTFFLFMPPAFVFDCEVTVRSPPLLPQAGTDRFGLTCQKIIFSVCVCVCTYKIAFTHVLHHRMSWLWLCGCWNINVLPYLCTLIHITYSYVMKYTLSCHSLQRHSRKWNYLDHHDSHCVSIPWKRSWCSRYYDIQGCTFITEVEWHSNWKTNAKWQIYWLHD